jgi:hypothetical protein
MQFASFDIGVTTYDNLTPPTTGLTLETFSPPIGFIGAENHDKVQRAL